MKTLKELLEGATPGPYYVTRDENVSVDAFLAHRGSGLALVDTGRAGDWPIAMFCEWPQAQLIARCNPATMRLVLDALTLAELNYQRTNHSQPDLMGDDEHEAWAAIRKALDALNGASHGEQGEGR